MSALPPLSTSNLSSVGASLLTTGQAPDAATPAANAGASSTAPSTYQTQFENLNRYDQAELLYASFLSPSDSLANTDSVLGQAAQLLGTPGSLPSTSSNASSSSTSTTAAVSPPVVPSVASILAASDAAANKTIDAYVNAPAGTSILDVQA